MTEPLLKSALPYAKPAPGAPAPDDLAKIKALTLRDFDPADLYVRTVLLAHNGIDRDEEVFDESVLAEIARQIPGKGVFEVHPLSKSGSPGLPEGLWFDAYTERMDFDAARTLLRAPDLEFPPDRTEAALVFGKFYMPVTDGNKELRTKIDAGLGFVSVGMLDAQYGAVKGADGRAHGAQRITAVGEIVEGSFVWLGAQQGARAVKSAHHRGKTVDTKALETKAAQLETDLAAATVKATRLEQIETALGADLKALLDNPEHLKAVVADGKAYRAHLVDATVAAQRTLKSIKADTDEQVNAIKAAYAALPTPALKAMHDTAIAALPSGGTINGSDPNAAQPAAGSDTAKSESDVQKSARAIAAKATAYINEQKAKGLDVTVEQAVAHVKSAA